MAASGTNATTLQLDADYDATDGQHGVPGPRRLRAEPGRRGAVTNETWQTWNPLTAPSGWWQTGNAIVGGVNVGKACTQASPCSFQQLLAAYPDAAIRPITGQSAGQPIAGGIWLKAGGGWTGGFTGNVDSLTVGGQGRRRQRHRHLRLRGVDAEARSPRPARRAERTTGTTAPHRGRATLGPRLWMEPRPHEAVLGRTECGSDEIMRGPASTLTGEELGVQVDRCLPTFEETARRRPAPSRSHRLARGRLERRETAGCRSCSPTTGFTSTWISGRVSGFPRAARRPRAARSRSRRRRAGVPERRSTAWCSRPICAGTCRRRRTTRLLRRACRVPRPRRGRRVGARLRRVAHLGRSVDDGARRRIRPRSPRASRRLRAVLPDYTFLDDVELIPEHLRGVHPGEPGESRAVGECSSSSRPACAATAATGTTARPRSTPPVCGRTPRRSWRALADQSRWLVSL